MKHISAMEPMLPDDKNYELEALSVELLKKSSGFSAKLNHQTAEAVSELVRSMNCYYSNLIEGHNTHPRDIDRSLNSDFSTEPEKRNLQLEAKAHIEVQSLIDEEAFTGKLVSFEFISWIHKEFCQRLPEELLFVTNKDTKENIQIKPGALRDKGAQVGYHIAPDCNQLELFLSRFEEAYNPDKLSAIQQIIAAAAMHHRLLWIHPFFDGNGRVTRLFSYAYLKSIGVGSSLWSIARGLARRDSEYKSLLMAADMQRQGDLDGRGNLSSKGLFNFCKFFLEVCIDQVDYMSSLLEPAELLNRMELYINEEINIGRLPKGSFPVLREAFLSGQLARMRVAELSGYKERQSRNITSSLLKAGLLSSESPRGALRIAFPLDAVDRYFPKLYPVS